MILKENPDHEVRALLFDFGNVLVEINFFKVFSICYQIFDDVLGRCQGVFYKERVWHLMEYLGRNETNYFMYWWAVVS